MQNTLCAYAIQGTSNSTEPLCDIEGRFQEFELNIERRWLTQWYQGTARPLRPASDSELEGRAYIGIDRYNMADITAQVALLTARGVAKLPIPEDHRNLSRWWASVWKRPTARA